MRKLLASILCISILFGVCGLSVSAKDNDEVAEVYMTVYCEQNGIVECRDTFTVGVTDKDNDGVITVNDALCATHNEYRTKEAKGDYATEETEDGLKITKLWGVEGGNYGFYVNHTPSTNLLKEVESDDIVYVYCLEPDSVPKKYCYFDKRTAKFSDNELFLTLNIVDLDKQGNPISKPLKDAVITLNGRHSSLRTDKDGKIAISRGYLELFTECNLESFIEIGAVIYSDDLQLLPPVCKVKYPEFEMPYISITIADDKGNLALIDESIHVPDWDGDGKRTVNDALISAHELYFKKGTEGYATQQTKDKKLTITKLWGVENDGGFGCYVNHEPTPKLLTELNQGDNVYAFCYQDTENRSDRYCFFNETSTTFWKEGETLTLTLEGYPPNPDEDTVYEPIKDATILIDGKETEFKTNKKGKVSLTFDTINHDGYLISAKSDTTPLTPPFCMVYVYGEDEEIALDAQGSFDADSDQDTASSSKKETSHKKDKGNEKTAEKKPEKTEDNPNLISPQTGNSLPVYALILFLNLAFISYLLFRKFSNE